MPVTLEDSQNTLPQSQQLTASKKGEPRGGCTAAANSVFAEKRKKRFWKNSKQFQEFDGPWLPPQTTCHEKLDASSSGLTPTPDPVTVLGARKSLWRPEGKLCVCLGRRLSFGGRDAEVGWGWVPRVPREELTRSWGQWFSAGVRVPAAQHKAFLKVQQCRWV